MGDPMDETVQLGPLATANGKRDIVELVEDAKAKGANILCGGETPEGPGFFYPATVIDGLTDDMRLVMEEAFGPGCQHLQGCQQGRGGSYRQPNNLWPFLCCLD